MFSLLQGKEEPAAALWPWQETQVSQVRDRGSWLTPRPAVCPSVCLCHSLCPRAPGD